MSHNQMRFWEFLLVAVLLIILSVFAAAQCAHSAPASIVTQACYYERGRTNEVCAAFREEAENYIGRRHWACASVVYILWLGESTEMVRCRGFDGSALDYVSDKTGNLQFVR